MTVTVAKKPGNILQIVSNILRQIETVNRLITAPIKQASELHDHVRTPKFSFKVEIFISYFIVIL